ncbi:PTS sugar transporter subunit IIA [Sphingomicrobium sediminis]|uniref:PTS sugar transporter subunit IIA n=1 Tax=Sphingomicrobium sediminis TaxID=2950949 RepID=A0A9X2EMG4_9SPHN|nr:PTS sugar transporter subunit IIA [Sphingomicrobium sediminis]MCM8558089.1 PTS sugar transporter subunit IIA [Sphingomicrobium sediminis]
MNLSDFIDVSSIRLDVAAKDKRALLQQMGQIAGLKLGIEPARIVDAIVERERLGSTGFGGGIAIPHGKIDGLDGIYGMVVRLDSPVDYRAIDKMPVDLLFLLLSPPDRGADHLRALAAVSRAVRDVATVERLRGARDRDAVAAVLAQCDERTAA